MNFGYVWCFVIGYAVASGLAFCIFMVKSEAEKLSRENRLLKLKIKNAQLREELKYLEMPQCVDPKSLKSEVRK